MRHYDYPTAIDGKAGFMTLINNELSEQVTVYALISADINRQTEKTSRQPLNAPFAQHKMTGRTISGSFTIFYGTLPILKRWQYEADKANRILRFDAIIGNVDKGSFIGKQVIKYFNVSPDSMNLSTLDIDSDELEESIDITAEDYKIMEYFTEAQLTGRD